MIPLLFFQIVSDEVAKLNRLCIKVKIFHLSPVYVYPILMFCSVFYKVPNLSSIQQQFPHVETISTFTQYSRCGLPMNNIYRGEYSFVLTSSLLSHRFSSFRSVGAGRAVGTGCHRSRRGGGGHHALVTWYPAEPAVLVCVSATQLVQTSRHS